MMCRTRTTQQAHPAPGDVSYLADSMREILITVDDGKSPPSINVREQNACLLPSSLMNTLSQEVQAHQIGNGTLVALSGPGPVEIRQRLEMPQMGASQTTFQRTPGAFRLLPRQ
jgi:hypothetical protein